MTGPAPYADLTASGRLRLRPPSDDDLEAVFRIHNDPRTNVHNPAGPDKDRAASRARLDEWLEHWNRHGFGYWVVETISASPGSQGPVVGFSGVRHDVWLEQPVLNLYYRFAVEHWGLGYASEVARQLVAAARACLPDRPVLARTTLDNIGSQRTVAAAGLVRCPALEKLENGIHAVILVSHWPHCAA